MKVEDRIKENPYARRAVRAEGFPLLLSYTPTTEVRSNRAESHPEHWVPLWDSQNSEFKEEKRLQQLLHAHPSLIPVNYFLAESDIVSLGREVKVANQYIDNIYLTKSGRLVLVEAKLVKNAESRRKVVAQALEYALLLARLSYDEFEEVIRTGMNMRGVEFDLQTFYETAFEGHNLSINRKNDFRANLSRTLREGRFLVLLVGDSIRDEARDLANLVSRNPHLQYVMGLVSIQEYTANDSDFKLLVPKVHVRVQVETRAHIKITQGENGEPTMVVETTESSKFKEFVDQLPDEWKPYATHLHDLVLTHADMKTDYGKRSWDALYEDVLLWRNSRAFGGAIHFDRLTRIVERLGQTELEWYLSEIVALFNLPNLTVKLNKSGQPRLSAEIPYANVRENEDRFMELIDTLIKKLQASGPSEDDQLGEP